jgi:hypothetical protein
MRRTFGNSVGGATSVNQPSTTFTLFNQCHPIAAAIEIIRSEHSCNASPYHGNFRKPSVQRANHEYLSDNSE